MAKTLGLPRWGEIFSEFMRIQVSLDAVSEIVDTSVMGQRRRLAIRIATTIAPAVMAGFWRHVLTQLPMVELQFFPMRPGEAEAEVLSGRYDLCLLTDPPKPNMKLTVLPLFRECLRLAMAADHSLTRKAEITPAEMSEEPYLDRLHCEFRSALIKHFMDRNIVMRPRVHSEARRLAATDGRCRCGDMCTAGTLGNRRGHCAAPGGGLDLSREVSLVAVSGSGNPREAPRS